MGPRRNGGAVRPSDRGQAALLGLVLLIGMVAAVSVGLLLVGGNMMDNAEQQSKNERIEQSFIELSQQMSTVSADQDASRAITFDVAGSGAVTRTASGNIVIKRSSTEIENLTMGSIEYEGDDGSIVAYQAGAVWRETGNQTRMISQPSFSYNSDDQTLWLPVTKITGDKELSSGEVTIGYKNTSNSGPPEPFVENDTVTLEITSKYHRGWKLYFEDEVEDAAVTEYNTSENYVKVELGRTDIDAAFDTGVTVSGTIEDNGDHIDDDEINIVEGMTQIGGLIGSLVEQADSSDDWNDSVSAINGGYTYTKGTYLVDEIDVDNTATFDLRNGNATVVVDGNTSVDGTLEVKNWSTGSGPDRALKIYTTGDVDVRGDMCVSPCEPNVDVNAAQLQLYGTPQTSVRIGQSNRGSSSGSGSWNSRVVAAASPGNSEDNPGNSGNEGSTGSSGNEGSTGSSGNESSTGSSGNEGSTGSSGNGGAYYEGVIYAPSDEDFSDTSCGYQVCIDSNADFDGSIVSSSLWTQHGGGNIEFEYDEKLEGFEPNIYPEGPVFPPDITYLNVAVHELEVKNT
ncbi:hypothetical protein [Natrinema sp. HArc-T2]|uniref:DUF7289 family protein n=1 Tax=Natrinema sp. HArc-T2 TaxID=3242701 RepID=UPI00359D270F